MSDDRLIEDNMKLVYYVVNKYYPTYMHDEDVIQEGMYGLCQAAKNYDPTKTKFSTYAVVCIKNRLRYYIKSQSRHYGVLSTDFDVKGKDGGNESFIDFIVGDSDVDTVGVDFKNFYSTLTDNEKRLIDLSLHYSVTEIGEILGKSAHCVSSHKSKIKQKWRKFIEND